VPGIPEMAVNGYAKIDDREGMMAEREGFEPSVGFWPTHT